MASKTSKDCRTKTHFTFIWTVENASALLVSGIVESPNFIVNNIEKTKWKLAIFINISGKEFNLQICRQKDNGPKSIEIECEISVLSIDGSPLETQIFSQQFDCPRIHRLALFKDSDEVFFKRKSEYLPNDTLTVRCRMWRKRTEISKGDVCFARTRLGVDRRNSVWAVRKFSSLRPGQRRTHLVNPTPHGSPKLTLSVFISEEDGKNHVNIEINHNSSVSNLGVRGKISLLDIEGRILNSKVFQWLINFIDPEVFTFRKFIEINNQMSGESLLPNDVLFLKYEFQIEAETVWSRIESYGYSNLEDLEQATDEMLICESNESCTVSYSFKKAFEDLYGDHSLSDVSLRANEKALPAHKNILSARSPVFKAMFTQNTKEKTSVVVDIPDLNAETLESLLLYIYKDVVKDLEWENAMDLFRAADKYQLLNLRKKCSFFLKSGLSVTNICSVLTLADKYEDEYLRKAAEYFISRHDNEVFKSDAWKNLKEENSKLAVEIMERVIHLIHINYE